MNNRIIVVDIETTGLNPVEDRITEIGAISVVDGKIESRFETLVNPEVPIPYRISQITGITDAMVKDYPTIPLVIREFLNFAGDSVLLGHNILFDYSFLKKAAGDIGDDFERQGIDTLKMAKKRLPDIPSRSLEALCEHFFIENIHHRALADAESTWLLYEKLLEKDPEEDIFQLTYKLPKREPATDKQKSFLASLIKKHKVEFQRELGSLSKSEASREIDRILSTYGIQR